MWSYKRKLLDQSRGVFEGDPILDVQKFEAGGLQMTHTTAPVQMNMSSGPMMGGGYGGMPAYGEAPPQGGGFGGNAYGNSYNNPAFATTGFPTSGGFGGPPSSVGGYGAPPPSFPPQQQQQQYPDPPEYVNVNIDGAPPQGYPKA